MGKGTMVSFTGKCDCGTVDATVNASRETNQHMPFLVRGAVNKLLDWLVTKKTTIITAKCNRCGKSFEASLYGKKASYD